MDKSLENRSFYFDNAKFLLICLVVFGHLLQTFIATSDHLKLLYVFIYTFHMPAFVLISGYFAKNFRKPGYLLKTLKKLILPYLFFQTGYTIFYYFLFQENSFSLKLLYPEWSLWFLLSLFFWNVMLLLFSRWPAWVGILLSIGIGLIAGYFDIINGYLSLSRTFVFFPFFLVGFFLKKAHFALAQTVAAKYVALLVFFVVACLIALHPEIEENWFLGSKPYDVFVDSNAVGALARSAVYVINFVMIASFFCLIPKRRLFFTKWGKNTLYVYLLHGFFIKYFREEAASDFIGNSQTFLLVLIISFGLTVFLSSSFVTAMWQPMIELRASRWKSFFIRNA
ncbi:acyltransferase family protein [Listeria booriae]|uniref:acyltransferase family protein n=1 Tax=Listeria booriae TaxID=1552123 RepID=UPI00162AC0B0|nr:acyltransferase family protein [Listeria booriae]MBC2169181.1 acyltransferase family protein [Listeria booriae]